MFKKILILVILFYLLVLFQTSFLVHFTIWGRVPNLILVLVIFWNLFEKSKNYFGLYPALIGGLFSDIFSSSFIGFNILILLAIAIFIKLIIKRHARIPLVEKI